MVLLFHSRPLHSFFIFNYLFYFTIYNLIILFFSFGLVFYSLSVAILRKEFSQYYSYKHTWQQICNSNLSNLQHISSYSHNHDTTSSR